MSFSKWIRMAGNLGGYSIARGLTSGHPRILMYHRFSSLPQAGHVDSAEFEWQIRYIAENFRPLTVSQLADGLFQSGTLPKNSIAITIDDGYQDFYDIAWPILQKYNVPATFYVTTGFVDKDVWLWPDQLRFVLERAPRSDELHDFGLFTIQTPLTPKNFEREYWRLNQVLLSAWNHEKLDCLSAMVESWGIQLPETPPMGVQPVTWEQLSEMEANGLEVGGHTRTHPSLKRVDPGAARDEILGCARTLEQRLGRSARSFCYPNGTTDDFVGEHVKFIQEAGFSCATVAFADSKEHTQRYAMRRHASSEDRFQFMKAVSGIELLGMKWRRIVQETPYD